MTFQNITPPVLNSGTASTGVRASIRKTKAGPMLAVTINAAAQKELFGEALIGRRAHVMVGEGDHDRQLKIMITPNGKFPCISSIKGSVRIMVGWWKGLPEHRKAQDCQILKTGDHTAYIELPNW